MRRRGSRLRKIGSIAMNSFVATETKDLVMPYARTQCFSAGFTTMIYVPQSESRAYKYNITNPNDLTTLVYSGESLAIGSSDLRASAIAINSSRYIIGRGTFYEYLINADFSLSASDGTKSIGGVQTGIMPFSDSVLFVDSVGLVTKRNLATSNDFTTSGVVVDSFQATLYIPYGISVSPDGLYMYLGQYNGLIKKYLLSSPFTLTGATYINEGYLPGVSVMFDFTINYSNNKLITTESGVIKTFSFLL